MSLARLGVVVATVASASLSVTAAAHTHEARSLESLRSPKAEAKRLEGTWDVSFFFERNTAYPDQQRARWFSFEMRLKRHGAKLTGTLTGQDHHVSGVVRGRMCRSRFRGSMRLDWDSFDWESLIVTLDPDGRTARGTAVFERSPTEKHFYDLRLTRRQ